MEAKSQYIAGALMKVHRKAMGVKDCPAGGSAEQLGTIKSKVGE